MKNCQARMKDISSSAAAKFLTKSVIGLVLPHQTNCVVGRTTCVLQYKIRF
jgi:hypothetical protein